MTLERYAFRGEPGSTMQQRSIVVLIVATALPAPVRPEPFWQRWQDSVIERLGVNYSSYVAAQVHKFDRKVVMNPEGSLDTDAQSKKTTSEHAGKFGNLLRGGVSKESMKQIADYIRAHVPLSKKFALCHGVNHGFEVQAFRDEFPGVEVLGTELAPMTAKMSQWTINWDFHVVKPEWRHNADFVYSNALDHSPNPKLAVTQWMREVASHGVLILEWSEHFSGSGRTSVTDVFGTTFAGLIKMVTTAAAEAVANAPRATGGLPPFAVVDRFNNSETVNVLHAKGVAKRAAYREWFVVRNTPRSTSSGA